MQAGNVQYAPKGKQNGPKKTQKRQEQPKGVKEKLYDMPRAAGIALMVLMIALSLPVGNFRALESAKPKAFLSRRDVASIVQDRIAEAGNAVKVASRGQVAAQLLDDITAASDAMAVAKNAREISRADQKLTAAVSNLADLAAGTLSAEDERMLTRALDNFAEQGSFLRQEARDFNKKAEKAEALYEKLPTKALFARPDVYEGI